MVTRESQQFRGVGFDLRDFASQPEALGAPGSLNTDLDYTNTVIFRSYFNSHGPHCSSAETQCSCLPPHREHETPVIPPQVPSGLRPQVSV